VIIEQFIQNCQIWGFFHKTPYKELFKAGSTHTGLLRELERKMKRHVLDACNIYKERHGVEINKNQYHVLHRD